MYTRIKPIPNDTHAFVSLISDRRLASYNGHSHASEERARAKAAVAYQAELDALAPYLDCAPLDASFAQLVDAYKRSQG